MSGTRNDPRRRRGVTRLAGGLTALGLVAATGSAAAGLAAPAAPPSPVANAAEELPSVTVRPDPSYAGEPFEGWGTSLVWFANATGDYPDEIRNRLADMLFGDEGLNLNIARYNIGGGNAPDVPDYLRAGADVDGWWSAPEGTTRDDVDWWDPENPDHWDADADATQRWWVDRIKDDVTHWETFSNSPPWFMTESGYVSGSFDANDDQLKVESIDDFAAYLVGATERLEDAHGIEVDTLDPFNEPNTNYWGTQLGADGNPTGGRQEGAHMSPGLQAQVIPAVAEALEGATTDTRISAMDETNPGRFATNWNAYPDEVRDLVDQMNVHTYGTGQRTTVRDLAKGADKPLWMSEVGGSWSSTGQDFESMESGLGSAQHIVDDLRELEPSAWVFWQPVEDYDNMAPGGESPEGGNWGEIQLSFSCTDSDTLETCPIYTNTKYWVTQNFTHHIAPGDRLVAVDDTSSTAAVRGDGTGATVVHVNDETSERAVTLDLSGFADVADGASVTPVTTSVDGYLVEGEPVAVSDSAATLTVPAESVTTFVVDGVSGVADDVALVQEDHTYRLRGVQSGLDLEPSAEGSLQIGTPDAADAGQLWRLQELGAPDGDGSHRTRYALVPAATGERVAVSDDGTPVLEEASGGVPASARWILSTPGDGTVTLVNSATGALVEVGGQATTDGAPVGTYGPNSGANQRWELVDDTVLATEPVEVFTTPGVAPELPSTVTPVYPDGARGGLPVTWDVPGDDAWAEAGTVDVSGTVAVPAGGSVAATATVVVDTLVSTLPARAKAYAGGTPELPGTVTAVAEGGGEVERPVDWVDAPAGAFDEVGVVELTGTADAGAGAELAATVRVQVTEPGAANAALADGTTADATYTEPGYPASRVVNGDQDDKGWSNWRSGTKNTTDTLTVTLPQARDVTGVVTHFYRDGSWESWAQRLTVEALVAGAWQPVGETVEVTSEGAAPVVEVPADVRTDAVRVVLENDTDTHMIVSEIEVLAKVPGVGTDATASSISADGTVLDDFAPGTASYDLVVDEVPAVEATATDPFAEVEVSDAASVPGTTTITVTAEDGAAETVYELALLGAPAWVEGEVYTEGDEVTLDGALFRASWWTTETPGASPWGSWQEIATAEDGTAVWTPSRIFTAGDVVVHEGNRYEAQWWTRNQEPGASSWGPWRVTD